MQLNGWKTILKCVTDLSAGAEIPRKRNYKDMSDLLDLFLHSLIDGCVTPFVRRFCNLLVFRRVIPSATETGSASLEIVDHR